MTWLEVQDRTNAVMTAMFEIERTFPFGSGPRKALYLQRAAYGLAADVLVRQLKDGETK